MSQKLFVSAQEVAPVGRRRRGLAEIGDDGVVAEGDGRPDGKALLLDQALEIGVAIVGLGREVAAEGGLGIGHEGREVGVAIEPDQDRLVVGDHLRPQREDEEEEE